MRLAFAYDAVHPWETGGIQTRVWEFACRLADDHDVHWYGLHYWDDPGVIEREGVTLHGIVPEQELYVDGRRSIREALSFSAHLLRPLLRTEVDVIDCQAFPYFPILASKAASLLDGTRLCVTWHEVWDDYWYEYLGRKGVLGKAVERLCGRLPAEHVAVSERTRADLARIGARDARVVPNGIDLEEIDAVSPADEPVDIVFAARLIDEKNPGLLVRAVDDIVSSRNDRRCWLVGDGPERERVERLIADLGLADAVTVTGFLDDRDDLLGLLHAADVFALPSRREGFGITALEALACGTPVATIQHDQNAIVDLVKDGETGAVTRPAPTAFAEGIHRASQLDAAACRRAAERYEWDRVAEEMEAVYLDALEGS